MTKKIQNLIVLLSLIMFFISVLTFAAVRDVSALSLAVETGSDAPPGVPPTIPSGGESPLPPGGNNLTGQEPPSIPSQAKAQEGAGDFEKRIKDVETRGKNLETWNSIVTALFIISLLFNVYFGLKVRYILRKIGTA